MLMIEDKVKLTKLFGEKLVKPTLKFGIILT